MTTQLESKRVALNNNFMTAQEQTVCMQIANSETPHSQRAMALLTLNEGNTQGQAADKSGLSTGQVKYWVARFRNHRLEIFPEALVEELSVKADAKTPTEIEAKPKSSAKGDDSAKTKSKGKKTNEKKKSKKKEKKTDKAKKVKKKNKKDKKEKKSKKKR